MARRIRRPLPSGCLARGAMIPTHFRAAFFQPDLDGLSRRSLDVFDHVPPLVVFNQAAANGGEEHLGKCPERRYRNLPRSNLPCASGLRWRIALLDLPQYSRFL